eukprot:jgi/Psemu1/20379/gm1.20379_g
MVQQVDHSGFEYTITITWQATVQTIHDKEDKKTPRMPMFSAKYKKCMKELQEEDLNPFSYHFETGFDRLCSINGLLVLTTLDRCKQMCAARTRLNSSKGQFDKD